MLCAQHSDSATMRKANAANARQCKCELTAVQKTVTKEGPNQGRVFWTCPNSEKARCTYFEWDDDASGGGAGSGSGRSGGANNGGGGSQSSGECYKVIYSFHNLQILHCF